MNKYAITGAGGFIGSSLVKEIEKKGSEVVKITRQDYLLEDHKLAEKIAGCEIVINLAGSPVLKRWNKKNRQIIRESRILTTRKMVRAMRMNKHRLFISASAVGIYDRTGEHDEKSTRLAKGFLAGVVRDWENEIRVAEESGIRTAVFRMGIVLGKKGGILKRLIPLFKSGLGGRLGNGMQAFPFIHVKDVIRAVFHVERYEKSSGIYNLVAPQYADNRTFTRILAKKLKRPAVFTVPGFVLRIFFGKAAEVFTTGQNVIPERLLEEGFVFGYPELEKCIDSII